MDERATALLVILLAASTMFAMLPASSGAELIEDSWVSKKPLPTPRSYLQVAVVNGKIYAIGGSPDYATNEEYDPATDTWATKTPMPTGRYMFGIAVVDNKIYCFGGQFNINIDNPYAGPNFTDKVEVYDPATDRWETKKSMPTIRSQFETGVINGKIYLVGGRTESPSTTVALNEAYDPKTDSWTTKAPAPYPISSHSIVVIGNELYLLGGINEFNDPMWMAVNQIYNANTNTWNLGAPIPTATWRSAAGATSGTLVPQRIYLVGGQQPRGDQATNVVQIYDVAMKSWSHGVSMPTPRIDMALAVVDDRLYVIGGSNHYILPGETGSSENMMYTPVGYPGSIDGTSPVIEVQSPENRTYNSSSISLVFVLNENASWMSYSLDGKETVTITGNTTISGLGNGLHNVTVYANDSSGNAGASETFTFTVEIPQEPFPILLVVSFSVVAAAVGAVATVIYLKKSKRGQPA
jgi:N-acetylneuraminic acid mutarotase